MASPGSRRLPHTGQRDDRVGGVVGSGGGWCGGDAGGCGLSGGDGGGDGGLTCGFSSGAAAASLTTHQTATECGCVKIFSPLTLIPTSMVPPPFVFTALPTQ